MLVGAEEANLVVPREQLPEGAREGSWLRLNFELDKEGEEKQREKISSMLDKLKKKDR